MGFEASRGGADGKSHRCTRGNFTGAIGALDGVKRPNVPVRIGNDPEPHMRIESRDCASQGRKDRRDVTYVMHNSVDQLAGETGG